jgi:hypothetical protein
MNITPFAAALLLISAPTERYDGVWWKSLSGASKEMFVWGDLECYTFPVRGGLGYDDARPGSIALSVDYYFKIHPDRLHQYKSAFHAIEIMERDGKLKHFSRGLDDEFWEDINQDNKIGFVHGYMACLKHYLGKVPQWPDEYYVAKIDKIYGIVEVGPRRPSNDRMASHSITDIIEYLLKSEKRTATGAQ